MKIAIFSDPHLGYARFEEDSYVQAERVIVNASENADIIICAGDIFDIKIPKLETIKRAIEIFKKAKVPIYAIHGNHERRAKEMVNPVQLLASGTNIKWLHGSDAVFEKDGEKIQLFGMGSVPEEYAETALKAVIPKFKKDNSVAILVIHQSIRELVPGGKDELSLEYLETLPFDLIVNGHIHETITKLDGRFLIPGSTVITQLKKDETAPKGYYIYDTKSKASRFIPVETRKFFYEELVFDQASEIEIRKQIREKVEGIKKSHPNAIIVIKVDGKLKEGLNSSDIRIDGYENVFIDNRLNEENLAAKIEKIKNTREANLSVREIALRELKTKLDGRIVLFDSADLFEKLLEGPEETLAYLEKQDKIKGT
ncbi:DNA double-strand break repair protein Mre11 [Candidatus Bilamarchaeum dharawalense]|uniref:DNA double-strand break repair protein Mre11 n=1 Tax=Candidatus Bilamarchaeum dharawalense TaxID=2885759 RepID=A0A5E4LKT4_9ARCH|nr:DNA double-strand break repair protein Mre11 [Candidatus Bilamarchaeum dharawalense]